jgi:hypothetical protein
MEIHYAKSWFRGKKVISEPWTPEKAKKAHDHRSRTPNEQIKLIQDAAYH